jgi:hypothetical protein
MAKILLQNKGSIYEPNFEHTYVHEVDVTRPTTVSIPRWGVVLGVLVGIVIATILISAIAIVYFAPRPGLYQESCEKRSCLKELNLKCLDGLCQCADDYYYEYKCNLKKTYMEKCQSISNCKNNTNLVCRDGVCKCYNYQYWNGKLCSNSSSYNQKCTNSSQCDADSILYCDSKQAKCLCETTRYNFLFFFI